MQLVMASLYHGGGHSTASNPERGSLDLLKISLRSHRGSSDSTFLVGNSVISSDSRDRGIQHHSSQEVTGLDRYTQSKVLWHF